MSGTEAHVLPPYDSSSPKRVTVLLNPHGGGGKACTAWTNTVHPWIKAQGFPDSALAVCTTEYAGHAREIVSKLDLSMVLVLIIIGGDGFVHETINGLLMNTAVHNTDPFNPNTFPPCLLAPCGSSNGFSMSVVGAANLDSALKPFLRKPQYRLWPQAAIPGRVMPRAGIHTRGYLTPMLATLNYSQTVSKPFNVGDIPPPPFGPPHRRVVASVLHVSLAFIAMHDLYQEVRLRSWRTSLRNTIAPLVCVAKRAVIPARVRFVRAADAAIALADTPRLAPDGPTGAVGWGDSPLPPLPKASAGSSSALSSPRLDVAPDARRRRAGTPQGGGNMFGSPGGTPPIEMEAIESLPPPGARVVSHGTRGVSPTVYEIEGNFTALSVCRGSWPSSEDCLAPGQPMDGTMLTLMYTTDTLSRASMVGLFAKAAKAAHTTIHGGPAVMERVVWVSILPGLSPLARSPAAAAAVDAAAISSATAAAAAADAAELRADAGYAASMDTARRHAAAASSGHPAVSGPLPDGLYPSPPVDAEENYPAVVSIDGEVHPLPTEIEVTASPYTLMFL